MDDRALGALRVASRTPDLTDGSSGNQTEAALWLLAQLDPHVQRRLWRRLALKLDPPQRLYAQYVRDLAAVQRVLSADARRDLGFEYVERREYDKLRSPDARSSDVLVSRYGSWVRVCFVASRLRNMRGMTGVRPTPKHRC